MLQSFFLVLTNFVLIFQVYGKSIQGDTIIYHLQKEINNAKKEVDYIKFSKNTLELGDFYYQKGLYTDAIHQYNNSLQVLEKQNLISILYVDTNNKLGRVYLALNNYNSAKTFFEVAEQTASKIDYTKGKAIAKAFLGSNYEKQGDYLKAMQFENESLVLFKLVNDNTGIAASYENMGSIYEDLMQYDKAYEFFNKSHEILKGKNNYAEANILNNIGDVYRKKGDYQTAIGYTLKALKIAENLNDFNLLESANKDLAKAYALGNEFEKAYRYRVISDQYKDKALKNQSSSKLATLQAAHQFHKKETEIKLLKEQNKLSKANQKLLLVVLISILIIVITLLYYFNKKRKATQKIQNYKARVLETKLEQKKIQEQILQRDNKLKTASLAKYSLSLSQKNKTLSDIASKLRNLAKREHVDFNKKLKNMAREIDFSLKQNHEWEEFNSLFSDIHPNFSKKLMETTTEKLSSSEIKLAMLLRLNLSSKEIASILRVTPDSVRVARYRLRKKLPIHSKNELVNFMIQL